LAGNVQYNGHNNFDLRIFASGLIKKDRIIHLPRVGLGQTEVAQNVFVPNVFNQNRVWLNWSCSEWICSELIYSESPLSQTGVAQNEFAQNNLCLQCQSANVPHL
jgi:hypothetical protein